MRFLNFYTLVLLAIVFFAVDILFASLADKRIRDADITLINILAKLILVPDTVNILIIVLGLSTISIFLKPVFSAEPVKAMKNGFIHSTTRDLIQYYLGGEIKTVIDLENVVLNNLSNEYHLIGNPRVQNNTWYFSPRHKCIPIAHQLHTNCVPQIRLRNQPLIPNP